MIRQQVNERPNSIRTIQEELIARRNEFVQLQQLDALKKSVVPESEVSDSIISDPIRAVDKEDYNEGILKLRLNPPINPRWEQCFRRRATAYSTIFSPAMIKFSRDRVLLGADVPHVRHAVAYFQQYCTVANEDYETEVRTEHRKDLERRRYELKNCIEQREPKQKLLGEIQL